MSVDPNLNNVMEFVTEHAQSFPEMEYRSVMMALRDIHTKLNEVSRPNVQTPLTLNDLNYDVDPLTLDAIAGLDDESQFIRGFNDIPSEPYLSDWGVSYPPTPRDPLIRLAEGLDISASNLSANLSPEHYLRYSTIYQPIADPHHAPAKTIRITREQAQWVYSQLSKEHLVNRLSWCYSRSENWKHKTQYKRTKKWPLVQKILEHPSALDFKKKKKNLLLNGNLRIRRKFIQCWTQQQHQTFYGSNLIDAPLCRYLVGNFLG